MHQESHWKSQANNLSTQTLDDKFSVLCRRLFWSHLQIGAAVSSYAHLMNALAIRKGWGQETSCPYLSKLYWVNLCVMELFQTAQSLSEFHEYGIC